METPFVFGRLAKENNFTDRIEETAHLVTNFKSLINTILISPRRWGKSSLVFKAAGIAMKARTCLWLLCPVLAGLLLAACGKVEVVDIDSPEPPGPEVEEEAPEDWAPTYAEIIRLSSAERNVAKLGNEFGLQVFRSLLDQDADKDMLFSPLSLSLNLSLCAGGGVGDTQAEILKVLGFSGLKAEDVASYYQKMLNGLAGEDPSVKFVSANSVWVDLPYTLKDAYARYATDHFCADISTLDLKKKESLSRINEWCARKTEGLIGRILDDSRDPEVPSASYLVNALYFKGGWAPSCPFDPEMPEGVFHAVEGDRTLTYLTAVHKYSYIETEKAQLVSLPYGNDTYRMVLALPREGVSIKEMLSSFTGESFHTPRQEGDTVTVRIPKFTLDCNTGGALVPALKSLGMTTAFDGAKANFSGMFAGETPFWIGSISQASNISLDEKGTEAASVTWTGLSTSGFDPDYVPASRSFIADRPFVFALVEMHAQTILMLGQKVQ